MSTSQSTITKPLNNVIKTSQPNKIDLTTIMKSYQVEQQVKYLSLQTEMEVLLQELQTLSQHKQKAAIAKKEEN